MRRIMLFALITFLVAVVTALVAASCSGSADVPAATDSAPTATSAPATAASGKRAGTVLLALSGSGTKTTRKFSAASDWDLRWSYDCSGFGQEGNFAADPNGPAFLVGVNQLGKGGSGVEHYHDGGTFYLTVISECDWSLKAVSA